MVAVRWLGTAGIEFNHEGRLILIDPYLSRLGKTDIFFRKLLPRVHALDAYIKNLGDEIDAVICGHTHFDHALDIPDLARHTRAPVLGCPSLDALLAISGLPGRVTVCRDREPFALGNGAAVTLIPSLHGLILGRIFLLEGDIDRNHTLPLRTHQYRLGAMHAVKVELGGIVFMHIGSAGFLEHELKGHRCDVLFLCAAGWKNTPAYPDRVIEILRPSIVVPIHYDDFSLSLEPGKEFRMLRSADIDTFMERIKRIGSSLEIRLTEPYAITHY